MADLRFPQGFLWGAATSSHQVEGNCTNNQWWAWEQEGGHIKGGAVSGLACDHYRRFQDDFALARELGHNAHRFSIEWSRVEPQQGVWDEGEVDHYRRVVESLHRHGLKPFATLHHFTNPLWFEAAGGWLNPRSPELIARYAGYVAKQLGDLVPVWLTINEPTLIAPGGYIYGLTPPGHRDWGEALTVARHVLMAHGRMYQAIKESTGHNPEVGPVLAMPYFQPADPDSWEDREAAAGIDFVINEYFLAGIDTGIIGPPIGQGEPVDGLKGTWDFIGLNYYSRHLVKHGVMPDPAAPAPPGAETTLMGYEVYPEGLYHQLVRLKKYGLPVHITENGISTLDDGQRSRHLLRHLREAHRALEEGVDLRGYFYWTLVDNFEWLEGYQQWFGLCAMEMGTRNRLPRPTAYLFRDIVSRNAVTPDQFRQHGLQLDP